MSSMSLREAGLRLQNDYLGVSVTINRWSIRKSFTNHQKSRAASPFGASIKSVSASKRLVNPRHPQVKAVTQAYSAVRNFYESSTLPYVEKDKRLLPAANEEIFDAKIRELGDTLMKCVCRMQEHRDEIVAEARESLKELFGEDDYPYDFYTCYGVVIAKPSLSPPEYLRTINPQEYEQRLEQFQLQMQQAVVNAEQALTDELATLVHHLADRLGCDENGNPKAFRNSSLQSLRAFFNRFQELKIRDGTEIDAVVNQAQELLNGHSVRDLREPGFLRGQIQKGMRQIEEQLVPLITPRARRRLGVRLENLQVAEEATAPN